MFSRIAWRRFAVLAALAALLAASGGCTYLRHRAEDALETFDVGVTWSAKPYVGIYGNCLVFFPLGYSYVDGWFAGLGGGQIGATRHYESCWGYLLRGYEEVGWGEFDKDNPETIERQYVGLVGIALPPYVANPAYMPACVHYLHLGWGGLVANARYLEIVDFILGWTTLDISGDDGFKRSKWPWVEERRPEPD